MLLDFTDGRLRADTSAQPGLVVVQVLATAVDEREASLVSAIGAYMMTPVRTGTNGTVDSCVGTLTALTHPSLRPDSIRHVILPASQVTVPSLTAAVYTWVLRFESFIPRNEGGDLDDDALNFVTLRCAMWRVLDLDTDTQVSDWHEVEIEISFWLENGREMVDVRTAYMQEVDGTRIPGTRHASRAFPTAVDMHAGVARRDPLPDRRYGRTQVLIAPGMFADSISDRCPSCGFLASIARGCGRGECRAPELLEPTGASRFERADPLEGED